MANLTVSIDAQLLKQVRMRALESGTTVHALIREYLQRFAAGVNEAEDIVARLNELAEQSTADSGGQTWTRDEIHDRSA